MNKLITTTLLVSMFVWVLSPYSPVKFARADLSDTLISCWEMDEGSGVNRVDSIGSNTLQENNSLNSESGLIGDAVIYNDPDAGRYLSLPDNASVSVNGDFTIATWVKINTVQTFHGYFWKPGEYQLEQVGVQTFTVFDSIAGTTAATDLTDLGSGSWHFIVAWYDSNDLKARIQVDNGTTNVAATGLSNGPKDDTNSVAFGVNSNDYGRFSQDTTRFYKRVLTDDERTDLYNSGAGRDCSYTGGSVPADVVISKGTLILFE
jgi:hypothetical protein